MKLKTLINKKILREVTDKDYGYDVKEDMEIKLYWCLPEDTDKKDDRNSRLKKWVKSTKKTKEFPAEFEIILIDGTKIKAIKKDVWRSWWMFEVDGQKFDSGHTYQMEKHLSGKLVDDLEQLKSLLKNFDWTYEYSDDYRSWSSGSAIKSDIMDLISKIEKSGRKKEVQDVWRKYAPKDWKSKYNQWRK